MKRFLVTLSMCVMLLASTAIVQAQPAAPGNGPGGTPGARGPGRGGFGGQQFPVGPLANIPPQVAQPTAEEIKQINDALKKFIDNDHSSVSALLKSNEMSLMLPPPRLNVAATYTETGQRAPRHEAFVERAKQGDIDLLLHGDSITDWWTQGEPKKAMFDKYFGNMKTANFAVAGDTTQGLLWGLKNGEGQGFSPKAIMLMIGTNNMVPNTAPEIAEGIGALVQELRSDFPNAKILLLAIFPRGLPNDPVRDKIAITNHIIQQLDDQKHVFYMDIGSHFLDASGAFLPDSFQGDNLHPGPKGYDLWGAAVKDKLAELMK